MKRSPLTESEYGAQCTIFQWSAMNERKHPELKYLFSTLNGVKLPIGLAMKCKRSGMKRGVPDIWLPIAKEGWSGLVLELKVKGNYATPEQLTWLSMLLKNGWYARVAYGADDAIKEISDYLSRKPIKEEL